MCSADISMKITAFLSKNFVIYRSVERKWGKNWEMGEKLGTRQFDKMVLST